MLLGEILALFHVHGESGPYVIAWSKPLCNSNSTSAFFHDTLSRRTMFFANCQTPEKKKRKKLSHSQHQHASEPPLSFCCPFLEVGCSMNAHLAYIKLLWPHSGKKPKTKYVVYDSKLFTPTACMELLLSLRRKSRILLSATLWQSYFHITVETSKTRYHFGANTFI